MPALKSVFYLTFGEDKPSCLLNGRGIVVEGRIKMNNAVDKIEDKYNTIEGFIL